MLGASKVTSFRLSFAKRLSGVILDLAAGNGTYHQYFHGDIISLDLTFSQLREVEGKKVCADAAQLPFKDNTFDNVWACSLIHYINADLCDYLHEWIRVTKSGGRIFVHTPNRKSPADVIFRLFHKGWASREKVVRLYTVAELLKYGCVYGEMWFLPILRGFIKAHPRLGHTLILEVRVAK